MLKALHKRALKKKQKPKTHTTHTHTRRTRDLHIYSCTHPKACRVMVGLITVEFDPRRTRADYPRCCRGEGISAGRPSMAAAVAVAATAVAAATSDARMSP